MYNLYDNDLNLPCGLFCPCDVFFGIGDKFMLCTRVAQILGDHENRGRSPFQKITSNYKAKSADAIAGCAFVRRVENCTVSCFIVLRPECVRRHRQALPRADSARPHVQRYVDGARLVELSRQRLWSEAERDRPARPAPAGPPDGDCLFVPPVSQYVAGPARAVVPPGGAYVRLE